MNNQKKINFFKTTLPYDSFSIILTNTDGSCCYNSIFKLLIKYNIINNEINTKDLQFQSVNWIKNNKNLYLLDFNMSVEDYILFNHNLSFKDYLKYYNIYSGTNNSYISNNRWGGIPELIALSNIYKVNINIYTGKTYLNSKNKIIRGAIINNKPRKDFRFQLLLCTTRNQYNITFNILYYENKYIKHFYALDSF